ncbi:peptidoglycan recognition protein family protein [Methylobacterium sp. Gmos1]
MPNATWLADVLRAAGLKVAEVAGWQTRGHAELGTIRMVMLHHTAGPKTGNMPSLTTVTKGRPDLAGPLCNVALGRDGTCYVVAAGLAYHAGPGAWQGIKAGNSSSIGVEAENTGVGEPWPEVQLDAYARLCAAVLSHVGAQPIMAVAHREWALPKGRKIDPAGIDMTAFRARVAGIMNGAPVRPLVPAKDATGRPTLRRGASGEAVRTMQAAIGVTVDGVFGALTEASVRAYQRAHGIVADGICGPGTWAAIDGAKAPA